MGDPECPECEESNYFRYKQIESAHGETAHRLVVVMVYCNECGTIIGIGAGHQ